MKCSKCFLPLLILVAGCGGHENFTRSNPAPTGTSFSLKKTTKILDPADGYTLVSQDATSVVLKGTVPHLVAGDVFVSKLGGGAVRHVVSVSTVGDTTTLQTTQASFGDAFDKLDFALKAFGKAQLGDIPATSEGVSFEWVDAPSAMRRDGGAIGQVLRVKFDEATLSSSIKVTGTADLNLNPTLDFSLIGGTFDAGVAPQFTGSLQVASEFGGSLPIGEHTWLNKYFTPFIPDPLCPFVFVVPHLIISSDLSGSASSALTSTYTLNAGAKSIAHFVRGKGWNYDRSNLSATTGSVTECKAAFGIELVPLKAELRFDIEGVAGPYGSLEAKISAEGAHTINTNGEEGIKATIKAGMHGEIGIGTNPDLEELLGFGAEAAYTIDSPKVSIFEKFFPFTGTGSIVVADNGNLADDVFAVSVDGSSLGSTDKGGSGQFRLTDLAPGNHTLLITCTDDGANGADVGTLGVTLADGLTFSDGSATYDGTLNLGQSVTLTVIVPATKSSRRTMPQMPRSRVVERPRR